MLDNYYLLNINHVKLTELIREVETNSLSLKDKKLLVGILETISDQEVTEETYKKKKAKKKNAKNYNM